MLIDIIKVLTRATEAIQIDFFIYTVQNGAYLEEKITLGRALDGYFFFSIPNMDIKFKWYWLEGAIIINNPTGNDMLILATVLKQPILKSVGPDLLPNGESMGLRLGSYKITIWNCLAIIEEINDN